MRLLWDAGGSLAGAAEADSSAAGTENRGCLSRVRGVLRYRCHAGASGVVDCGLYDCDWIPVVSDRVGHHAGRAAEVAVSEGGADRRDAVLKPAWNASAMGWRAVLRQPAQTLALLAGRTRRPPLHKHQRVVMF